MTALADSFQIWYRVIGVLSFWNDCRPLVSIWRDSLSLRYDRRPLISKRKSGSSFRNDDRQIHYRFLTDSPSRFDMIRTDCLQIFLDYSKAKLSFWNDRFHPRFDMTMTALSIRYDWRSSLRDDDGFSLRDDLTLSSKWGIPHPLAYDRKDSHFPVIPNLQSEHSYTSFSKR